MAETYGEYFAGLARSAGQGVTLGFGDEIEAAVRAIGPETYEEEVAKIRADLAKFQETNPISAFAGELAGAVPTAVAGGAGLASLGIRGAARVGAIEGAIYGAGTGEDAASRAVGAAVSAPVGAVAGKVGEKAVEGIAPLVGRFMKRGSGSETRGATDIQLDAAEQPRATVFDVETGVTSPLEKTVGVPRTSGLPGGVNPAVKKMREIPGAVTVTDSQDYSPIENALRNAEEAMGASPTKGLTGEQYLSRLPKVQSISKDELAASGLESFLRKPENLRRKIPAEELLAVAKSRLPKIKSYTLNHRSEGNRTAPEHQYDQRILRNPDEGEADDLIVDYFETVLYNDNETDVVPLDFGHFNNRGGEFAHARGTIINDPRAPGRQSTFIEEGQGDIVDAMIKKETFPKQIKQAEEELARLERLGADQDDITRQQETIFYLQQASKAYERAQPLTPQLRESFDTALEKMEADAQFKTLPDLQKRRAAANQRKVAATTEATDAARTLPRLSSVRDARDGFDSTAFGQETKKLFAGMIGTREIGDRMTPGLADIISAQDMDNYFSGFGESLIRRASGDLSLMDSISRANFKGLTAEELTPQKLTADQIEQAKKHAIGMYQASTSSLDGTSALNRYNQQVMNSTEVPDPVIRSMATDLHSNMMEMRSTFNRAGFNYDDRLVPNKAELFDELAAKYDARLIQEVQSVDASDYLKSREQWLPAAQKVSQAAQTFRNADQEVTDILVDEQTIVEEAAKRHSPGPGFLEYLSDMKKIPELADAAQKAGDRLLPYQPYTTKFANNRAVFMNAIQKAKSQGHKYFYFPDYRDVAIRRPLEESTRDIEDGSKRMQKIYADHQKKFENSYKDAPEAVIKELKQTFPDLETGTFDPESSVDFRRMFSDEMNADRMAEGMKVGERVQDRNLRPVTYIDLDTMDTNFKPRRYAKGGQVDLRAGIGNMFRLYS